MDIRQIKRDGWHIGGTPVIRVDLAAQAPVLRS
jgi:hypothetical protein